MRSFDVPAALELERQTGEQFASLVELMRHLLAPDGCPWDREQDERSLRRYVLEEACEVIDAIDAGDDASLCEELGDLALQVAFLAELARRRGAFGPDDVMRTICEKLVRRHPHVFGDERADTAGDVETNWEQIKRREKAGRGLLDGVPRSLPALRRAVETSRRVATVGFDWDDPSGSRAKVLEELSEVEVAIREESPERVNEEFGDLLFALVNWARHLELDPEQSLRAACDKFRARFEHVEAMVQQVRGDWPRDERGKATRGIPLTELDGYWEAAKS